MRKIGKVTSAALASGALVTGTAGVATIGAVASEVISANPAGTVTCNMDPLDFDALHNQAPPHDTFGSIVLYTDHCGHRKGIVDISPWVATNSSERVVGEAFLYDQNHNQIGYCRVPDGTSTCSTGWINHDPAYAKGHLGVATVVGGWEYLGNTVEPR